MVKRNSQPEAREQAKVIQWCRLQSRAIYPDIDLIFCSLAGVKMTTPQAARAKQQGNRSGVFDLVLPVPRGGRHGLFIEMKSMTGRATPEQQLECRRLSDLGYSAVICYGAESAITTIKAYYSGGAEA